MNNVLIDDRRIKEDFSQSVAKVWNKYTGQVIGGGGGDRSGGIDSGECDTLGLPVGSTGCPGERYWLSRVACQNSSAKTETLSDAGRDV